MPKFTLHIRFRGFFVSDISARRAMLPAFINEHDERLKAALLKSMHGTDWTHVLTEHELTTTSSTSKSKGIWTVSRSSGVEFVVQGALQVILKDPTLCSKKKAIQHAMRGFVEKEWNNVRFRQHDRKDKEAGLAPVLARFKITSITGSCSSRDSVHNKLKTLGLGPNPTLKLTPHRNH